MTISTDDSPPIVRLTAELIALRERTDRQHKLFEKSLAETREELKSAFGKFMGEVQSAFQHLRGELTGERRLAATSLSELIERSADMSRLLASNPPEPWAEQVAVAARGANDALARLGVYRFDALFGDEYKPAIHERVGVEKAVGLRAFHVARQIEPGFAGPETVGVLRRAKVILGMDA